MPSYGYSEWPPKSSIDRQTDLAADHLLYVARIFASGRDESGKAIPSASGTSRPGAVVGFPVTIPRKRTLNDRFGQVRFTHHVPRLVMRRRIVILAGKPASIRLRIVHDLSLF
jgi:hypothetical protein